MISLLCSLALWQGRWSSRRSAVGGFLSWFSSVKYHRPFSLLTFGHFTFGKAVNTNCKWTEWWRFSLQGLHIQGRAVVLCPPGTTETNIAKGIMFLDTSVIFLLWNKMSGTKKWNIFIVMGQISGEEILGSHSWMEPKQIHMLLYFWQGNY